MAHEFQSPVRHLAGPLACAALALVLAGAASAQPPIVQPGAPGEASREISAEEARALSETVYTPADVRFMQHMQAHHAQAVEMNDLIADRTDHPGIERLGQRIAAAQKSEIALMRTWLERRGEPHQGEDLHRSHAHRETAGAPSDVPLMPGMLSPAQMAELRAARGDEFDRLFLAGMIEHHEGAIDMADALLREPGSGQDPSLSEFLGGIVADQSAEIRRMQSMLAAIEAAETSGEERE